MKYNINDTIKHVRTGNDFVIFGTPDKFMIIETGEPAYALRPFNEPAARAFLVTQRDVEDNRYEPLRAVEPCSLETPKKQTWSSEVYKALDKFTKGIGDKANNMIPFPVFEELINTIIEIHTMFHNSADLINMERRRQILEEGFTDERDDQYTDCELILAAMSYAYNAVGDYDTSISCITLGWPFDSSWWKPVDKIRDLTKAGALIAAEIDRLKRLEGQFIEK